MVGDRYELGELIGYGGMAEVHRGRDTRLNRDVAIKILRADLARDPAFLNRFRREAHSAAGLNHPSIVSVYDTGEDFGPDGTAQPFIVMEFVEGRTLRDIVKAEGSLPARRAMEITADICAALDFSHRNGIIHRDIKPANVMITPAGAVKVMDFGIARAVADNSATVTQTANVIGTAQYLSPEQARGETVDARSDVYSTGCLLYELVTGGPPFQGDSPVAVAYQHVRENPVMPSARKPDVPRVLDSIVMKALAKNQLNRYQSAGDMRSDLQRALANQPVTAEAVMTDAERTQFIARTPAPAVAPIRDEYEPPADDGHHRRTGLIWAAIVAALVLVIGGGLAVILLSRDSGSDKVDVPTDLQGLTVAQASAALKDAGLTLAADPKSTTGPCTDTSQTPEVGRVCTISPVPGSSVKKGSEVTVTLYKKPAPTSIQITEDLTGKSYTEALKLLQTMGINASRVNPPTYVNILDSQQKAVADEVVAQQPEAFGSLEPGKKVTLQVSTGLLVLPNVKGESKDSAVNQILNAGFKNPSTKSVKTTDKGKDGTVASVSVVDPGVSSQRAKYNQTKSNLYHQSAQITLTVYKYEAPQPTCTSVAPTDTTGASGAPTGGSSGSTSGTPSGGSSSSSSSGLPPCTN